MDLDWMGLMPADVEVQPKYRKRVRDRVAKGLCINVLVTGDGKEHDCDAEAKARGLCNNCHYAFRMEKLRTPARQRLVYENDRIRKGTLLSGQQGKKRPPITRAKAG